MVRVCFLRAGGRTVGVEVRGHAGRRWPRGLWVPRSARYGNIVCAAVSVLCRHLANALVRVEGLGAEVEEGKGLFRLRLPEAEAGRGAREFEALRLSLEDLVRAYPDAVEVLEEEIHVAQEGAGFEQERP